MKKTIAFYGLGVLLLIIIWSVAAYGDTQERVTPPSDANKMHFSIVGEKGEYRYETAKALFDTDADLSTFKKHVHFHDVASNTAIYKERYEPNIDGLPTLRLQLPDGVVIYERAGASVPVRALLLKSEIELAYVFGNVTQQCPWKDKRRCRPPMPPVEPTPIEPPTTEPPCTPDPPAPDNSWLLTLAMVMACIAGSVGGVVYEWKHPKKKTNKSKLWNLL